MAASQELNLQQSESLILVEIQPCKVHSRHNILDIHYYRAYSTPLVFDITCVQCLVGRIKLDDFSSDWAIIDRSGTLAQAYYVEERPEDEGSHIY